MEKLTIQQLMKVTGMSYPTALTFAKENGEQESDGGKRARWLIPVDKVQRFVLLERNRVNEMMRTLEGYKEAIPA